MGWRVRGASGLRRLAAWDLGASSGGEARRIGTEDGQRGTGSGGGKSDGGVSISA